MELSKKGFPLDLGYYNSTFIPKNTNSEKPNIYLIEQIQNMYYNNCNNCINGNNISQTKEKLSQLICCGNRSYYNSINNSEQSEKILYNENKKINPIYNFYKSTENYLRETNNICIYYKNSRNYIFKYNMLKNNIQFPNISLKEGDNSRNCKNFNISNIENYLRDKSYINLNNRINENLNNTANRFNRK